MTRFLTITNILTKDSDTDTVLSKYTQVVFLLLQANMAILESSEEKLIQL